MSYPFIIWTMQRTGGTALADLLMEISEHKPAEHEPFNRDRQFGAVTIAWGENRNEAALTQALSTIFARGYLIKHTYELRGKGLNSAILSAAGEAGYRHILLSRRDEFSRLVSRFVAEANGTWFKDYASKIYGRIRTGERVVAPLSVGNMVAAYRHCRGMTEAIRASLKTLGGDCHEVDYEDLFTGEAAARLACLGELFDFLDFPPATIEAHQASIDEKILGEGQETRSIIGFIPNLSEVIRALSAVGCVPPPGLLDGFEPPPVVAPLPAGESPAAPAESLPAARNMMLIWEFQRLAEKYGAQGPFLEIGPNLGGPPILSGDYFGGSERHGINLDASQDLKEITTYRGRLSEVTRKFRGGYFSTIFSNAALEHDGEFWSSLREMKRVLASRGFLMIAVPGFREPKKKSEIKVIGARGEPVRQAVPTVRVHGPSDYWRFSPRALREVILKGFDIEELRPIGVPSWLIGVGVKPVS
jgi:hypothetical protein